MRNLLFAVALALLAVVHSTPVDTVTQIPVKTEDDVIREAVTDGFLVEPFFFPSRTTESPKTNTTVEASRVPSPDSTEGNVFEGSALGSSYVSTTSGPTTETTTSESTTSGSTPFEVTTFESTTSVPIQFSTTTPGVLHAHGTDSIALPEDSSESSMASESTTSESTPSGSTTSEPTTIQFTTTTPGVLHAHGTDSIALPEDSSESSMASESTTSESTPSGSTTSEPTTIQFTTTTPGVLHAHGTDSTAEDSSESSMASESTTSESTPSGSTTEPTTIQFTTTTPGVLHAHGTDSTAEDSSESSSTQSPHMRLSTSNEAQSSVTQDHISASQTTDPAVSIFDYMSTQGSESGSGDEETTTLTSDTETSTAQSTFMPAIRKIDTVEIKKSSEASSVAAEYEKVSGETSLPASTDSRTPSWIIIVGFVVGIAALVMLFVAIATRDKWNGPTEAPQLEDKVNASNQQREIEMETFLHKDRPLENGKAAEYTVIPLDELSENYSSH